MTRIFSHVLRMAWRSRLFRCPFLLIAAVGIYLGILQVTGNFHEIIPGELYRSGQLSPDKLADYVQKYKIRTIINLRGEQIGERWYDEEVAFSQQNHVRHINFGMISERQLSRENAFALISLMKDAPKPLLIHCQAGANRTGLAAALYLAAISKQSEFQSELQLSLLYGHLPFSFFDAYAMDQTFEAMEQFLGYLKN